MLLPTARPVRIGNYDYGPCMRRSCAGYHHPAKADPVVMLSLTDYNSLAETCYLLKSPKNAFRLRAALDGVAKGNTSPRALSPVRMLLNGHLAVALFTRHSHQQLSLDGLVTRSS